MSTAPAGHAAPRRAPWPVLEWLWIYRPEWLGADLVAGLTSAAVVIPKAMAYATIAGLPVQVGLYTAFVPLVVYAVLGTSRPLSVTTTTTLAILAGAQLSQVAAQGDGAALLAASATLTLLVGAILVAAALLRLGFLADFISEPVLVGFKAAVGVVIVVDQLPKLLGVHFEKGTFLQNLLRLAESLPHAAPPTVGFALAMLALLIGFERFLPRLPAPLIAVAAGIAGAALLALPVDTVGAVPRGLPQWISPDLGLAARIWPGALGIALMSFTETIAAGRAFVRLDEPPLRPNQELLATGLANLCGAGLGAMAGGGGTSQTAVNRRAGARSQLAGLFCAGVALVAMLVLAPLIGLLPQATLAAVVVVYSIGLIEPQEFRAILAVRRMEFLWAIAAFAGVVLLGTLQGILVAIVLSLVSLSQQVADPPIYALGRKRGTNVFRPPSAEHPDDETFPGLLLVRIEGRVFFANARRIGQKLRTLMEEARPQVVALDLASVPDLEYTALKMLNEAEERLRADGVALWLVNLNPGVLEVVQRSPLGPRLGRERMIFNREIAIARYLESRAGAPVPRA